MFPILNIPQEFTFCEKEIEPACLRFHYKGHQRTPNRIKLLLFLEDIRRLQWDFKLVGIVMTLQKTILGKVSPKGLSLVS